MSRFWPGDVPPWERDAAESGPVHRPFPVAATIAVFTIALAAWFPYADTAYWKSDDFLAIAYAADPNRAASDLHGNQYGLEGLVWFYRPWITLSFALDYAIGGTDPFVSHLSNAIAHAISTVLVMLLASRFTAGFTMVLAALAWSLAPAHAGSVLWAVGRVDSHTTVWILASAVAVVRATEGRPGARFWSVAACILALLGKEQAIVIPGLAAVVGFALGGAARVRTAWTLTWPLAVTLGAYLAWRLVLFGRLGGYGSDTAIPSLGGLVGGFGVTTMRWLNPLEYSGEAICAIPDHVWLFGFVPVALALVVAVARRRFAALGTLIALYSIACVPLFQLLPHSDNLVNLRYLYLPGVALTGVLALGGWLPLLLAILVWALPFAELRQDWAAASRDVAARHARILDVSRSIESDPLLVADLAPHNRKGTVLQLHVGVDRLARPPFAREAEARTIYALRPLAPSPTAHRLPFDNEIGSPLGTTLGFSGPEVLGILAKPRYDRLDVEVEGSLTLGSRQIHDLNRVREAGRDPAGSPKIVVGGAHEAYRFTIFTAMGYVTSVRPAGGRRFDAVFDLLWFDYDSNDPNRFAQALTGPTVFDLSTRFPLMIEGGRIAETRAGTVFETEACARHFLWLQLDRQFANLMNGVVPR